MLREWFDEQMARLVVLRGSPATTDAHFEGLGDIPPETFAHGIGHALKTRTFFPVPAELRADCDTRRIDIAPRRRQTVERGESWTEVIRNPFGGPDLVLTVTRDWDHDCTNCEDYGFASRWCGQDGHSRYPWLLLKTCERRDEHYPHEWVERCVCIESNPTILRRQAARTKYSQPPEKVTR